MYAVIQTGGKQYKVAVGDKVKVELLKAEAGDQVDLDQVLMIADGENVQVGTPKLDSAVQAKVIRHARGDKLRILKFRRRQNSRTRGGHRQHYTELEITGIGGKAAAKSATKPAAKKAATKKAAFAERKPAAKKPAAKKAAGGDDLTKISGVGPVIVGKLEALGITTYKQIAEFSADDIAKTDEELNFKGRIERDEWVKQAKELMEG
ncbi:MAG: 50S ribosomal protein L21 [Arenicella sp.]